MQTLFSADRGAYVGYSTCDAPFYLVLTDCISTLRQLAPVHPMLSELRQLFALQGASLPPDPGQPFRHGMAFFARLAGDAISTIGLMVRGRPLGLFVPGLCRLNQLRQLREWCRQMDPDPKSGSITLNAGWQVNGIPYGAPNEGYVPVPGQLLRAVVNDPGVAYWFWRNPGASKVIH